MKQSVSVLIVVVVVLLIGLLSAPSAEAETVRRRDARNDAASSIDIWAARYTHSQDRVRVVATIPGLGRRGTASLSISQFTIFEAGHVLQIRKKPGQEARVRLFYFDHFELQPRRCASMSGVWTQDRIRLSVARSCLGDDARRRVFVQFGIKRGASIDRAPAVKRLRRG